MTEAPHIPPGAVPEPPVPPGVNPAKPSPARLYDYYLVLRPRAEVERFFAGMDIVPPYPGATDGLTFVGQCGAVDPASADSDGSRVLYCGVAKCR